MRSAFTITIRFARSYVYATQSAQKRRTEAKSITIPVLHA